MPDLFARWGVFVDWSVDGTYVAGIDDISRDVESLSWYRGAAGPFASGNEGGGCTIELRNGTNKYSDMNVSSTLNGKLKPGRAVWITATIDAVTYPVFAGYMRTLRPTPSYIGLEKRATMVCDDAFAHWGRLSVDLDPLATRDLIGIRTAVLDEIGVPAGQRSLAPEVSMTPMSESVGQNAATLLAEVNNAGLGGHVIKPTIVPSAPWTYVSVSRHHKLDAAADVALTYGSNDRNLGFDAMTGWEISDDAIINRQDVRPYQDPLSELDEDVIVRAEDTASQTTHGGVRAAAEIHSEWISGASEAGGVAEHMVWRLASPRQRLELVLQNRWVLGFSREPYDVVTITDARLPITARRMEITGIRGTWGNGAECTVIWTIQDAPEQTVTPIYQLNRDAVNTAGAVLGR